MENPEYEYHGLMAESWDVLRGDTSNWDDRPFYLAEIRRFGEPVLDVGCGTGRLLLDYARLGIDIDGLDDSPEMLVRCRDKGEALGVGGELHVRKVEELELPRRYRTILVPSSTLQLIVDPVAASEAVKRLHDHLAPGGAVLASFMTLWYDGKLVEEAWETSAADSDGVVYRRVSISRIDPVARMEHTEDRYEKIRDGAVVASEVHKRSPATRSYTQAQARTLFESAGFTTVEILRGFTGEPAGPEDLLFTVRAIRSEPGRDDASGYGAQGQAMPANRASDTPAVGGPFDPVLS